MSNWLSKSKVSFQIANNNGSALLRNNRVHCFYYGCIQLLKHVVHTNFAMDVASLELACNRKLKPEFKGTHQYLKLRIKDDLDKKSERIKSVDFNTSLVNLHNLRTKADYSISDISPSEMDLAKEYTTTVKEIIGKFYTI